MLSQQTQDWLNECQRASAGNVAAARARDAAIRAASPDGMTAMGRALAKVEAAGRRTAINYAKSFARQFLRTPQKLNSLSWNLSQADPEDGIRTVRRLAHQDGDTHLLCGAMIAFRWARRHERAAGALLLAAE
ncbi:hypothetical protein [Bosea sp. ASV33]|uniref:hypothetical protein n=1 Tax=Bosea sp. ASV33 TaxID=2795106 RepID=UPI0018EC0A78|nr:hypothetical protein [Bosea sp. ASV33]